MDALRQEYQQSVLALEAGGEGEAGAPVLRRVEASIAESQEESRTESGPSMEEIFCDRRNLIQALKRVRRNDGKVSPHAWLTVKKTVAAWSMGPDGDDRSPEAAQDDIVSW